jgi:hypothetical protein
MHRSSIELIDSSANSVGISKCANEAELCPSRAVLYEVHPIVPAVLVELDRMNVSARTLPEVYL